MLLAEAISNVTGLVPVIDDIITVASKLIQFVLTTFPLNVGAVIGLAGAVTAFIRKVKPAGRA